MPSTRKRPLAGRCAFRQEGDCTCLSLLWIDPAWRRRGYGSYLLRQVLHRLGGYAADTASCFAAPLPQEAGGGRRPSGPSSAFGPRRGRLVRRRKPDLTAVRLAQEFLAARLQSPPAAGGRLPAATAGIPPFCAAWPERKGRCLPSISSPAALKATAARLEREGIPARRCGWCWTATQTFCTTSSPVPPTGVMFNFGWLPGADHAVHSSAGTSIPALEAALQALRPGGVLSAVLYSGAVIGDTEKQAVLSWLHTLPLERYTVLTCSFANWAASAPLPCFVLKK